MARITLGTRASALALAQTGQVEAALRASWPGIEVERRIVQTTGDQRLDLRLSGAMDERIPQGLFVREIEDLLLKGEIDAAVHSLKDLPTEMPEGLCLGACLERASVTDVLVSKGEGGLESLPDGAVVATSSPRRLAQLRLARTGALHADIRGNVPTRLSKLAANDGWHAVILARAGLERLGILGAEREIEWEGVRLHVSDLPLGAFLPAPGQGAIGIEIRVGNGMAAGFMSAINHSETLVAVRAERAWLAAMGGGCSKPMAALAQVQGERLALSAAAYDRGGARIGEKTGGVDAPEDLGRALAREFL